MSINISGAILLSGTRFSNVVPYTPSTVYAGYNGLYKLNTDGKTFTTLSTFNINTQTLTNNNTILSNGKYGIVVTSNNTFQTVSKQWTNIASGAYPSGTVNAPPSLINGYFYQVITNGSSFQVYNSIDGITWSTVGPAGTFSSGRVSSVYSMNGNICVGLVAGNTSTLGWYLSGSTWSTITGSPNPTSYAKLLGGVYFKGNYYIPSGYDPYYYKGSSLGSLTRYAYNLSGVGAGNAGYNYLNIDQFIVSGDTLIGLTGFSNPSPITTNAYAYQIPFAGVKSTDGNSWSSIPINDTTGSMKWSRSIMNHIVYTDSSGSTNWVTNTVQAGPGANGNTYGFPNYYSYALSGNTISNNTSFIQLPIAELITGICFNL